ncbi:MAG: aspartate aminotransferase family protein [Fimbriimonadaceae bacterium]
MHSEAIFDDVVSKYSQHINPGLARLVSFAGFGVEMEAEGCYITDHEGRRFLDCLGGYGVFSLGHRHPKVVEAVRNQLDRMPLSGKAFFSQPAADLAAELARVTPPGVDFFFFCNSGAEAVEGALKFAKKATGRRKIVSTEGGFHGKTIGALSTTGRDKYRHPYEPLMPGVEFVPYGDAAAAREAIDEATACVIVEPVQGEGGIRIPPDGYLAELRRRCDEVGALLVVDEVQTGLGRTGRMFGCEHDGVSPDILTMAKALGGGVMPIGAIGGTERVWDAVFAENPLTHTSTFGGNPMACAAGLATVRVIQEEGLVERSAVLGQRMLAGLRELQSRFPELIADVRGRGLMIGVEFAMDEVGELTVAQLLMRGMCAAYTLNNPRVMRLEPPLILSEEESDFAVRTLGESVEAVAEVLAELQ